MGHTGVGVSDRTVTKTCIKLPVVIDWYISSDSPLHWIPCHSSLNGQIDEFMHNWGLYYEKENEGSVSSLTVKGGRVGDEGSWKENEGGRKREAASPLVQRTRWGRRRKEAQKGELGDVRKADVWRMEVGSRDSQAHLTWRALLDLLTQPNCTLSPPNYLHWGCAAMSSRDCKWIKPCEEN